MKKRFLVGCVPSGHMCVLLPLYPRYKENEIAQVEGFALSIDITPPEPMAYIVDCGEDQCPIFSKRAVEKHITFLGEL